MRRGDDIQLKYQIFICNLFTEFIVKLVDVIIKSCIFRKICAQIVKMCS